MVLRGLDAASSLPRVRLKCWAKVREAQIRVFGAFATASPDELRGLRGWMGLWGRRGQRGLGARGS